MARGTLASSDNEVATRGARASGHTHSATGAISSAGGASGNLNTTTGTGIRRANQHADGTARAGGGGASLQRELTAGTSRSLASDNLNRTTGAVAIRGADRNRGTPSDRNRAGAASRGRIARRKVKLAASARGTGASGKLHRATHHRNVTTASSTLASLEVEATTDSTGTGTHIGVAASSTSGSRRASAKARRSASANITGTGRD
jgi:hypothetical protein